MIQSVFFTVGWNTADQAAASVSVQQRCLICGVQSSVKKHCVLFIAQFIGGGAYVMYVETSVYYWVIVQHHCVFGASCSCYELGTLNLQIQCRGILLLFSLVIGIYGCPLFKYLYLEF